MAFFVFLQCYYFIISCYAVFWVVFFFNLRLSFVWFRFLFKLIARQTTERVRSMWAKPLWGGTRWIARPKRTNSIGCWHTSRRPWFPPPGRHEREKDTGLYTTVNESYTMRQYTMSFVEITVSLSTNAPAGMRKKEVYVVEMNTIINSIMINCIILKLYKAS